MDRTISTKNREYSITDDIIMEKIKIPAVKIKIPEFEIEIPEVEIEIPEIDIDSFEIEDIDIPNNLSIPDVERKENK